jgi:hypothetical protein
MIGPLLLLGALVLALNNVQPPLNTPQELASFSKCEPARIAFWTSAMAYKVQPRWEGAAACMARKAGDCKCYAVIAKETLAECGVEAFMKTATNVANTKGHAFTLYVDHKGRRGYINGAQQASFPPDTEWADVVADIDGGIWRVR